MPLSGSRIYYGWVIVGVALLMNIASSPLNAGVFSFFVTPMSEDLGWSKATLSLAMTFRLLVAGASGPMVGVLIDKHGSRYLGAAAGLIAGTTTIGLAFIDSVWQFYALAAISGISGFGAPAGQLLTVVPVAKWFHANRGRALAIATVGLPLGATIFFILEQQLIDAYGWRNAWAISGVMLLLFSVPSCLLFMRKDPESMGVPLEGHDTVGPESEHEPVEGEENWTASQVLRSRALWMIVAAMALSGFVLSGTVVYRVSFWEEDVGLSTSLVAFASALDPLTVTVSALVFGFMAERTQVRYLGFIGGLVVGISMVFMAIGKPEAALLIAYNVTWGIGMGATITANNNVWPDYFGRKFLGTIRGVVFPISVATSAISPPLFALMLDTSPDPRYVWLVSLAAFVMAGVLFFLAKKPRLSDLKPREGDAVPLGAPAGGS